MRLRAVSIEGFKGISDEIKLELSPTLTAIFGPNYYGKSSILEAIQWCLYCNSGAHWRTIRKLFEDIELVNKRKDRARVSISYDVDGEVHTMLAETKPGEVYGFKKADTGIFKNLTLGELEFTEFIRVITSTQIRKFESKEDLEALDIVFNVTFWRELADKSKKVAESLLEKERELIEKEHKWKEEMEKTYTKLVEKLEEAEKNVKDIEEIRKEISELLGCDISRIPSKPDELIDFLRRERLYEDEIRKLEEDLYKKEEKVSQIERELQYKRNRITKIEKILPEIRSEMSRLEGLPSKESLLNVRASLEERIRKISESIRSIENQLNTLSLKLLSRKRDLERLESIYSKLRSLKEKLDKYEKENLDLERENLEKELESLKERKNKLEEQLGRESKIIEILDDAIKLMESDACIVCDSEGGKTRAEKKLERLKRDHADTYKKLEEVRERERELEEKLEYVKRRIEERDEIKKRINDLLSEANARNFEELERRIEELKEEYKKLNDEKKELEEQRKEKEKEIDKLERERNEISFKIGEINRIGESVKNKLAELGVIDLISVSISEAISEASKKINDLEKERTKLEEEIGNLESEKGELEREVQELKEKIESLRDKRRVFEEKKSEIVGELEELRKLDRLKKLEEKIVPILRGAIKVINDFEEKLSEIERERIFYLKLNQVVNLFIKKLVEDKLDELNKLIEVFFKSLYDHPEFKEIRVEASDRGYKVVVRDSSGREYDEKIFSTSGKDMVRLAIGSACSYYGLERGEFNLLIIDEPQQHLDSKHKKKFAEDFLRKVCEKCQVILATADEELWNLIRQHAPEGAIFYKITDWSLDKGPVIERV